MSITKRDLRGKTALEISIFSDSPTGEMRLEGPQSASVGRHGGLRGVDPTFVRVNPPAEPGKYTLSIGGETVGGVNISRQDIQHTDMSRSTLSRGWNGTIRIIDWPAGTGTTVQEEYHPAKNMYGIESKSTQQNSNMALGISPDDNVTGGGSVSATGLMSDDDNNSSTGLSTTLIAVVIGFVVLVVGMGDM